MEEYANSKKPPVVSMNPLADSETPAGQIVKAHKQTGPKYVRRRRRKTMADTIARRLGPATFSYLHEQGRGRR